MTTYTEPFERKRLQDRVPLDAISADAHRASPSRAMQGLIGGFFFSLAWLTGKIFQQLFLSVAWCFSAAKMGWRAAHGQELDQPSIEEVLAENFRLRREVERMS
jgi:hypothetical protein